MILASTDLYAVVSAVASLLTAFGVFVFARAMLRQQVSTREVVAEVHKEVKTANGISLAKLVEREEGRRIIADILKEDRSTSEQRYVDELEEGGRNLGHTGVHDITQPPEKGL